MVLVWLLGTDFSRRLWNLSWQSGSSGHPSGAYFSRNLIRVMTLLSFQGTWEQKRK